MRRDYLTTFAAEALVVASALLAYRVVAVGYGPVGFAEYAIARRSLTLFLPLCVVGLDVALPRLVAYSIELRPSATRSYLLAAVPIAAAGLALTSLTILLFPDVVSRLFFGSAELATLVIVLPLMLAGATSHVLLYGHLRGRSHIVQANLLMVANHAMVPLLMVLMGGPLERVLASIGVGWIVVTAVAFAATERSATDIAPLSRDLARIGVRRVPGDMVQLLFFALPVILTAQIGGLAEAGVVAFGITALGMIGSSLTPVGFVMLPLAARMMGRGSMADLRIHVVDMLRIVGPMVVLGVVALEVFAEEIVVGYLGPEFSGSTAYLRLILLGAVPWGVHIVLRSIVDARHERAVNARNLTISFVVFVLVAALGVGLDGGVGGVLVGFVIGLVTIGALTLAESYRALRTSAPAMDAGPAPIETA